MPGAGLEGKRSYNSEKKPNLGNGNSEMESWI